MSKPVIPFDFTANFQEQVLALMLGDAAFCKNAIDYIPEDRLYSDAHKYLWGKIKEKFQKRGELLSFVEVEDHLKTVERHKRRALRAFCQKVFAIKPENPTFMKEKLTEYAKRNAFIDIFMTAQTFWNSKNHDKAFQYTMEGMNHLYGISFFEDVAIPVEKFEEVRQLYLASKVRVARRVPTNIERLDEILRGGLEKGELGILLAEPKKGKSIGLLHMGCMALMTHSGRVAHFVLEGTTEQAILRYLSRLSGIPYRRLEMDDDLSPAERKKIERIEKKYIGRLDLIPMNAHWNYTVLDIESKLKELESMNRKPDLVVVDYADLLKAHEAMEKRHEQTEVYRDLKRLAVMKKLAIWTASQARRPSDDRSNDYILRAKDISESFEKVRIADLVCTLNQTSKEKENGILRFHLDIYRSNESDETIHLITDYERMIFSSKLYGEATPEDVGFDWMKSRRKRK